MFKHSKLEEIKCLKDTLALNEEAIDYIDNHIFKVEDILKLCPEDEDVQYELKTSKYIKFSLEFLDKCYKDRLKVLGVKNFKVGEKID